MSIAIASRELLDVEPSRADERAASRDGAAVLHRRFTAGLAAANIILAGAIVAGRLLEEPAMIGNGCLFGAMLILVTWPRELIARPVVSAEFCLPPEAQR
jgi:hypothetical protein